MTDADRALAEEALRAYGKLQMDSDVMRCKLASILLMAHTVLGNREERGELEAFSRTILPLLKAEPIPCLVIGYVVWLYG